MKRTFLLLLCLFIVQPFFAQEKKEIKWWSPVQSEIPVISSQGWSNELASPYHRLPARAENQLRKPVWQLSKHSAGLSIRFWSNANSVHVKYNTKGGIEMRHMPATGVSGVDLYSKSLDGEWSRCWGSYKIDKRSNYTFRIEDPSEKYQKFGREYQLFLPLYNEIDSLELGVDKASFLDVLPVRNEKPIVVYGTSIAQGACASRPGMAWTTILERKLERPIINLGFSGQGRFEPELLDLMIEIDAKLYILDCLPNINPKKDDTYELIVNAVKKIRDQRPTIPILLTDHIGFADEFSNKITYDSQNALNEEMKMAIDSLKAKGFGEVYHLEKDKLGLSFDSFVDRIHPNDIGMMEYANAYEKKIRSIFNEDSGKISTNKPISQSRDISTYKWEYRHQEILRLNESLAPKICLFGNSIINFWGGAPNSSVHRGQDSWNQIMKPLGVRNFGFGWDRIENVLWRVYHDELDGFKAEKIVLMIGTNNLHLNTDSEIIEGLESLIKAIKIRQPESEILMIGILPRRAKEDRIEDLNIKISRLAHASTIEYQDIGSPFLKEGGILDESLFSDGLHPNESGYNILANQLQALLKTN